MNATPEAVPDAASSAERDAVDVPELVARHGAAVLRLGRAIAGPMRAEDVFQETFLAAHRGLSGLRAAQSAAPWLFAIARREAWRMVRADARIEAREEPLMELGLAAGWGGTTPEDLALRLESAERLEAALATLTAEEREVLALRDEAELPGPEAAAVLGISLAALKSRLHRARLRLLAALRLGDEP